MERIFSEPLSSADQFIWFTSGLFVFSLQSGTAPLFLGVWNIETEKNEEKNVLSLQVFQVLCHSQLM